MARFSREAAEQEANKIGLEFAHSNDVVGDMSRAYHVDFSNIKVHTDSAADSKVKAAGKDALAQGNDLFFGRGIFESSDPADKGLVAHEFAHTMQQGTAIGSEGAVSESAPMGEAQGGIRDWFKNLFHKKPKAKLMSAAPLKSESSDEYMKQMRIAGAMSAAPELNTGLSDEAKQTYRDLAPNWKEKSDASLKDTGSNEAAKAAIGLRLKTDSDTKKELDIRNNEVFKGSSDVYAKYMDEMIGRGADIDQFNSEENQLKNDNKAFKPGNNQVYVTSANAASSMDILAIINKYMESGAGQDYVKTLAESLGQAEVFQEGKGGEDVLNFIMSHIINYETFAARDPYTKEMMQRKKGSDNSDLIAKQQFFGAVFRNLSTLPIIKDYKEEDIPELLRPLVAQYKSILTEMEKVIGKKGAA